MEVEKDKDEDGEVMLPGFRFHPTDQELVGFYLKKKVEKKPIGMELIKHMDIYKYDPWDLPKVSNCAGDKEWYFFCRRGRKYRNSIRPNRVTGSGFWKATGIDKPVYSVKEPLECIGLKKSLVYYRGSAGKGTKTDWMMNEFRLPLANNHGKHPNSELHAKLNITQEEAEVWTLCRIFKRIPSNKKYTPADWEEASLSKQNIVDSSSKTGSLELDHCSEPAAYIMSLEESVIQPVHTNHWSVEQLMSPTAGQAPFEASYSSFRDPNDNDIFADGSWDELRPVVQLAFNYPSQF